jgi:hypothetical protein
MDYIKSKIPVDMDDQTANRIVFFILLFAIIGIVLSLHVLLQGSIMNKLKNSTGNLSSMNIIMMFAVFVAMFFLIRFFFNRRHYLPQMHSRT